MSGSGRRWRKNEASGPSNSRRVDPVLEVCLTEDGSPAAELIEIVPPQGKGVTHRWIMVSEGSGVGLQLRNCARELRDFLRNRLRAAAFLADKPQAALFPVCPEDCFCEFIRTTDKFAVRQERRRIVWLIVVV